ncbi:MAG: DUF2892 domain-containing protein [Legionellaceae bacterium]|nr:DUF2892 domain-containing protein [Legionellaceae bacterium]
MFLKKCNINKTDRINRAIIGAVLFFAALIGMSKLFFMIVGLVLVIEGLIGWCSIPYLMNQFKKRDSR